METLKKIFNIENGICTNNTTFFDLSMTKTEEKENALKAETKKFKQDFKPFSILSASKN